jgi:hypothetical protein
MNEQLLNHNVLWRHAAFEVSWRLAIAGGLIIVIVAQFLLNHHYITLPENQTLASSLSSIYLDYFWWLFLLIALADGASRRSRASSCQPPTRLRWAPIWLLVGLLGAFSIAEQNTVTFLVHRAAENIDSQNAYTGHRYALTTTERQVGFMLASLGSVAATLVASVLMWKSLVLPAHQKAKCIKMLAIGVTLLLAAATYNWWYYKHAYSAVSPDLAGVEIESSWSQRLCGGFLAWILVLIASARATKRASAESAESTQIDLPLASDAVPAAGLLLLGGGYYLFHLMWLFFSIGGGNVLSWRFQILSPISYPVTLFMAAIMALSMQLLHRRWMGATYSTLRLIEFSRARFAYSVLLFSIWFAVAIPTFAAFSFSVWLGGPLSLWNLIQ